MSSDERVRQRAARVWRARQRFELAAAARFTALSKKLEQAGAPSAVTAMAQRAIEDEYRHAALCGDLAEHFGGARRPPIASAPAPPLGPKATGTSSLLFELVAMSCITETLSTTLLSAMVEQASDSVARNVMHGILRDEVRHAKIGWAYLAQVDHDDAKRRVAAHLPAMLGDTVNEELFDRDEEPEAVRALVGLGQLPRTQRRRLLAETLTEVVFPGLERFGLDASTGRAWLERRLESPSR